MCGLAATLEKLDNIKNKELDGVESNLTNKYYNSRSNYLKLNVDNAIDLLYFITMGHLYCLCCFLFNSIHKHFYNLVLTC